MPMIIREVLIEEQSLAYLKQRGLDKQYFKAVRLILIWYYDSVDLRKRRPKKADIYYFKINKQFRAIGKIKEGVFWVTSISNHQE